MFLVAMAPSSGGVVQVECDGCGTLINGKWYRDMDIDEDLDLCSTCFTRETVVSSQTRQCSFSPSSFSLLPPLHPPSLLPPLHPPSGSPTSLHPLLILPPSCLLSTRRNWKPARCLLQRGHVPVHWVSVTSILPHDQYLIRLVTVFSLFLCRGYGCDKCDMSILTHRFHSNTKQDFDLCLGCFRKEEAEGCDTLVLYAHNAPYVDPFPSRNCDEWTVYLLTEQPATATSNKFLSQETGMREGPL